MAFPIIFGQSRVRRLVAPGSLFSPLTLTRSQSAGVESTALGSDGTTWQTYAADVPRFNGTAQRLLIGGARTNGVRNPRAEGAVAGSPGTAPTNWALRGTSAGVTQTIVGVGTENGLPYLEVRWAGTTSASATGAVLATFEAIGTTAASVGQVWTASEYCTLVGGSMANVTSFFRSILAYDGASALVNGTYPNSPPTSGNLGTSRYERSYTMPASTASVRQAMQVSWSSGVAIDFTLRIAVPQIELGSFASTPILPPVGSPAASTRGADLITATLASLGIGANGACTVLWSGVIPQLSPSGQFPSIFVIDDGTNNNRFIVYNNNASTQMYAGRTLAAAGAQGLLGTMTVGAPFSLGAAIDGAGRIAASLNGATAVATTGGPTSGLTTFRLGSNASGTANMFGETARLSILPYALSDAALQAAVAAFPTS